MVTINNKQYDPKIKNSHLLRYASISGVGVTQLLTLLENITPAFLVGVFVFAANKEGIKITEDEIWDEYDRRQEVFNELAEHLNQNLIPQIEETGPKKKE